MPTLVLGALYWRELVNDYEAQLESIPQAAQSAKDRIVASMVERFQKLLESEARRPFTHYGEIFSPEDAIGSDLALTESPLVSEERPREIEAWFSFEFDYGETEIHVLQGDAGKGENLARKENYLSSAIADFRKRYLGEGLYSRLTGLQGEKTTTYPLAAVAVFLGYKEQAQQTCLKACASKMEGHEVPVNVFDFELDFYLQDGKRPRAIASRRISFPIEDVPANVPCLASIEGEVFTIIQGFILQPEWLFNELPQLQARRVLAGAEELLTLGPSYEDATRSVATINLISELGFDTAEPEERWYRQLEVAVDREEIRRRFEKQSQRFLLVAFMLVLTLSTGMVFMYRSVSKELDHAHRMQNFVAAVTHELRTPISTIQLHAEMLLEGWTTDPEVVKTYHARILRETKRLSTLVERVLEKSRLKERTTDPVRANLSEILQELEHDLVGVEEGGPRDVRFELERDLPPAWLTPEAVVGIATNLVENARKYAPVPAGGEPICVRTRSREGHVYIEVADRGPGVPAGERDRIFEAFYRVGSEATRTTKGTGLGLHLVQLFAESVGAQAQYLPRDGGGSIFQVAFKTAG